MNQLRELPNWFKSWTYKLNMKHAIIINIAIIATIILLFLNSLLVQIQDQPDSLWPRLSRNSGGGDGGDDFPIEQTNVSHILFGIGGSAATWKDRSGYTELWWDTKRTRGFVWLDNKPDKTVQWSKSWPSYRVSEDCSRFKFVHSISAVRIARIVLESFKLGLPNVRWFVMGDDDTVFFVNNLVSVLAKYDHRALHYIGGNSESVEQDLMHSYDMAFGGGGFAISYALAAKLVNVLDKCIDKYYIMWGSDQRVWACVREIGVPFTREPGFHQLDIRGDPYGILAAHPVAPLVSLHHIEYLNPLLPNKNQIESLKSIIRAYRLDPGRTVQQSFCYDHKRKWSVSISWGYTAQLYPWMVVANDLERTIQTFKTWQSWSDGPFTFNTQPVRGNPCERPIIYFVDRVEKAAKASKGESNETLTSTKTLTSYEKFAEATCDREDYGQALAVQRIIVSAQKMDPKEWIHMTPRRQCCEVLDGRSLKNDTLRVKIRRCKSSETVTT